MSAPFFFSYAHNDTLDGHLDEFFDEVNKRVRLMTGSSVDGFRDDKKIRAGELWSAVLVEELRESPAMVCAYSPSYFKSEICAQEMALFLERRARYIRQSAGSLPANIIPVLWIPPLRRMPLALPDFQYEKPLSARFGGLGVWDVRDGGARKEFAAIAKQTAIRVKEAFKTPLPALPYTPALGGVPSAFGPPPLPLEDFDASRGPTGPSSVAFVYASSPAWDSWPYRPTDDPLLHIAAAVAKGRDLQSYRLMFDAGQTDVLARLEHVRQKNNLIVLLVDGSGLADPLLISQLRQFDAAGFDASALVAWRAGSRSTSLEHALKTAFPRHGLRQVPFFYPSLETPDLFAEAVAKSLDTLRTVVSGKPYGIPTLSPTSEFCEVPLVHAAA